MVARNPSFTKLKKNYLFVEIAKRRQALLDKQKSVPQSETQPLPIVSLGIGDTTQPIPEVAHRGILNKLTALRCHKTYTGYPPYNGDPIVRQRLSSCFYEGLSIDEDDIFISDGAKPDLGRLQFLFGPQTSIAVQDPVYPVYVDSAVMSGKGETMESNIVMMKCTPENNFFPDLSNTPRTDLIFFCSPNNPTGTAATRKQLEALVKFAQKNKSIIIFDSAYREFISDPEVPKSIYEIEGAREVAFETGSFSKLIGFTGVRLGWTVCPKDLKYSCGLPVRDDWARVMGTVFNGPSNLAEAGAGAVLTEEGQEAIRDLVKYYMSNVAKVKPLLEKSGIEVYGGIHSPYLWVKVPECMHNPASKEESASWGAFQSLLDECCLVCTPGVGFGSEGEGFIRLSMFACKSDVEIATERLEKYLGRKKIS